MTTHRYKNKLSSRQRIVRFVVSFWKSYGYAPTLGEIARGLDMNSTEAVRYHIRALRAAGTIEWTEGNGRTIRIAP